MKEMQSQEEPEHYASLFACRFQAIKASYGVNRVLPDAELPEDVTSKSQSPRELS